MFFSKLNECHHKILRCPCRIASIVCWFIFSIKTPLIFIFDQRWWWWWWVFLFLAWWSSLEIDCRLIVLIGHPPLQPPDPVLMRSTRRRDPQQNTQTFTLTLVGVEYLLVRGTRKYIFIYLKYFCSQTWRRKVANCHLCSTRENRILVVDSISISHHWRCPMNKE